MSCFLHVGIPCVYSLYKNVVPCAGGFRVIFSLLPLGDASQEFVTWTQQAWKWRVVQERCRETCWNTVHAQTRGTTKWMIKCAALGQVQAAHRHCIACKAKANNTKTCWAYCTKAAVASLHVAKWFPLTNSCLRQDCLNAGARQTHSAKTCAIYQKGSWYRRRQWRTCVDSSMKGSTIHCIVFCLQASEHTVESQCCNLDSRQM